MELKQKMSFPLEMKVESVCASTAAHLIAATHQPIMDRSTSESAQLVFSHTLFLKTLIDYLLI